MAGGTIGDEMIEDFEHWHAAKLMIDRFGDEAGIRCAAFANAKFAAGDASSVERWLGIASKIQKLRNRRTANEPLNQEAALKLYLAARRASLTS